MMAADIWVPNRFIREPTGNGSSLRIPTLKVKGQDSVKMLINSNEDKANIFAKMFFPLPPLLQEDYAY